MDADRSALACAARILRALADEMLFVSREELIEVAVIIESRALVSLSGAGVE